MASSCSTIDEEARKGPSLGNGMTTGTAEGTLAGYKHIRVISLHAVIARVLKPVVKALNEVLEDETFKFNSKVAKEAHEAAVLLLDWIKS